MSFIYGTHYWRAPNPAREEHRFHLTKIKKELGLDLVKCRVLWNWHHRRRDEFTFDELHEICDICSELGLGVLLELNLESAPYWLEAENPQTRYVNANGSAVELGPQEATPGGGYPGLCFHHDVVKHEAERFVRAMVRQFREKRAVMFYDCWNEPHLEPVWCCNMWGNMGDKVYCYCEGSRAAFRDWLRAKYREIEVLNRQWGRAYTTFEQVQPPRLCGHYADWMDWFRFWLEELQQLMRWRVGVIKEEDSSRPVLSHSGAVPPVLPRANACIDNFRFAETVDGWGTSFAPQVFGWNLATCAQVLELTRAAANGKPFWISEMPGGAGNIRGFRSSRVPRAKDYRLWNWLGAATGSTGTVHWCYLSERTGQEAGNYGMVRLNGESTDRSRAIAETAAMLKRYEDVLTTAEVQTQVAVLYEPDASALLFAMELEDKLYGLAHIGFYQAIWKADLSARYVTCERIDEVKEKVLIVPMALTLSDEAAERLAKFVYAGGVLIAEARTGLYDSRGWMRGTLPAGRLAEAAGVVEGEQVCSDPSNQVIVPTADGTIDAKNSDLPVLDAIHRGPEIAFDWPVRGAFRVREFLTALELRGAEAIGKCGETVLATRHTYGKGVVYYFGTYVGLALEQKDAAAGEIVREILLRHAEPVMRGGRLRPRWIRGATRSLVVIFNDHRTETISEAVALPAGMRRAVDIYSGKEMVAEAGRVEVTVGAEECVVLDVG